MTKRLLEVRWAQHVIDSKHGSELPVHRAIRKHGAESFTIETLEECPDKQTMKAREIHWIAELNTCHGRGYNATEGGEGVHGYVWTEEALKNLSESRMGEKNHNFGKVWAPNKGEDNPMFGKNHSEEAKAKISAASSINKRKSVECYDKKGVLVATYPSLIDAAVAVGGHKNKISECLCGHRKTHKQYIWKYLNESSERN